MERIIKAFLDRDFKNCLYGSGMFAYKVSQLINDMYSVKEVYKDNNKAIINIGDICTVGLTLSDSSYIRNIEVGTCEKKRQ